MTGASLFVGTWPVRVAAARGLGQLGDGRAVQALVAATRDLDRRASAAATAALHRLGWPGEAGRE